MTTPHTRSTLTLALLTLLLILTSPAVRADQSGLVGQWEGNLALPGIDMAIKVTIMTTDTGLTGTIDIPMQQAFGLPLIAFETKNDQFSFRINDVPGDPTFIGKLSATGSEFSGDFHQAGQSFPFKLTRVDEAAALQLEADRETRLVHLRAFIDSMLTRTKTPGFSISIVDQGELVFAEGFGLRSLSDNLPATANTIYAIGSCTKAFTATAAGLLVEDGLLDWDEPVRTYLPHFKLHDEVARAQMTTRDMLCHRSGLPRHDMIWYTGRDSRENLFHRLAYLEPTQPFRYTFQYQNLMFMTAGYLVGQLSGSTWEQVVQERLLDPLRMTRTVFTIDAMTAVEDHARPYTMEDDNLIEIPYRHLDGVAPAGSINSSVTDMANWMIMQLAGGKFNDQPIVKAATLRETHQPHITMPGGSSHNERLNLSYGLGWMVEVYRGHRMVQHGGGIDGFTAWVVLFPDDGLGICCLTNRDAMMLNTVSALRAADLFLDLKPIDWHARLTGEDSDSNDVDDETDDQKTEQKKPVKGTKPSHKLEDYTGEFAHPGYGTITVTLDNKKLRARLNEFPVTLEHWHYDIFRMTDNRLVDQQVLLVSFRTNDKGDIGSVETTLEPELAPIVFMRQASRELHSPDYLQKFVGKYQFEGGPPLSIELKGDKLFAILPGQPTYELEPYQPNEFNLKGLAGFTMVFVVEDGKVVKAQSHQPNGIFTAERSDK
jgi:CubicO group peptidase (beta-lactamase class C family)